MARPLHVLIVEDSEDDFLLLTRALRKGGFDPHALQVYDAASLAGALDNEQWDLVIADHNLPGFSADSALEIVKQSERDVPFIIVSGSIGEDFAVAAMKAGAHDYLMKGNLTRLVPAVNRELREAEVRRAHREAENAIRHMAFHDELTDLSNRRQFERGVRRAVENARRKNSTHALFYMDLDQFKLVNDTCGHAAGDDLLRELATLFRRHVREEDVVARLGGDEFGILLQHCPLDRALQVAEKLRQAVSDLKFLWRGRPFHVGVSVGVVEINRGSVGVGEALRAADMACYAAKDMGRNRVHVYAAGDAELARRHGAMQWVSRLRQALDADRFLLYGQAIVPLRGSGTEHCEFLLRLRDEAGRLVSPGAFITAAEHYNLMPCIDRWVIHAALSLIAERKEALEGLSFINISGSSLSDEGFFIYVRDQFRHFGVPGEAICFEITETAAITHLGKAVGFMTEAKRFGCRFALDDFGSGLSSFAYLKTIPADFLKIDGGFVKSVCSDAMDHAIVEAVNRIGHAAGIQTVAEFVETDAIRDHLIGMGVDYGQGYGIEAPRTLMGAIL